MMLGGLGYQVLKITETRHDPRKVIKIIRGRKISRKSKGKRKWGCWAYN